MELSLKESLRKLEGLSPAKLDETSRRIRTDLGGAEWKMGICLLAAVRTKLFRALGYATISEYAEKVLQLSGQKTGRLLSVAGALEHLPLLSEAFRTGKLCWGKLRAFNGLVTPETEAEWLDFALAHSTAEVVNKVALSPSAWKKYGALKASLEDKPIATAQQVSSLLNTPAPASVTSPVTSRPSGDRTEAHSHDDPIPENGMITGVKDENSSPGDSTSAAQAAVSPVNTQGDDSARASVPLPGIPQKIRLVIELTPDQYALFERAESRARAQAQKRVSRAEVVTAMAQSLLEAGTARSRAKHQVLIHTDGQTGAAWYDTEKGPLPVDPEVLEKARGEREPLVISNERVVDPQPKKGKPTKAESVTGKPNEEQAIPMSLKTEPSAESSNSEHSSAQEAAGTRPLPYQPSGPLHPIKPAPAKGRRDIPNSTLRHLHALAGQRCQRCGDGKGPFEAHHTKPISEGGTHEISVLRLLCRACHSLLHEPDFATKPHWAAARAAKVGSRLD